MIITKTPYRISLFGGGTDFPDWYNQHGGLVLSFTINKYCYLSARVLPPFFEHSYRISYSKVETTNSIDDIKHPAVRESLRKHFPDVGVEIHHHGDLPARSGIGSSSAFAVGIIHALKILSGSTDIKARNLAEAAIYLEQDILHEIVGSQDQIACSFGGLNLITFNTRNSPWEISPIRLDRQKIKELEDRMILVYTGIPRTSSEINKGLVEKLETKEIALMRTSQLASLGHKILTNNQNLDEIGDLLHESWELKKQMNPLSVNDRISSIYQEAINLGAIGGKILGAGGGGFMLFWIKESSREEFLSKFSLGIVVPFSLEENGSTCLLNS